MANGSKSSGSKSGSGGVGFFGLLQLILITLKLCKILEWSWGTVLIPTWIGLFVTLVALSPWILLIITNKGEKK